MLHAACRMLQAASCMLHVACCMLHAACCMLHVACCMSCCMRRMVAIMLQSYGIAYWKPSCWGVAQAGRLCVCHRARVIRRPPRSTPKPSSAASDVYKRQGMFHVAWWTVLPSPCAHGTLHVACCMLHVACCMLHAACCICLLYTSPSPRD